MSRDYSRQGPNNTLKRCARMLAFAAVLAAFFMVAAVCRTDDRVDLHWTDPPYPPPSNLPAATPTPTPTPTPEALP